MKLAPIHDLEAEMSALGSAFLTAEALAEVSAILKPEDFYRPAHQTIFRTMRLMHEIGLAVDLITLRDEIGPAKLADCGGINYLISIQQYVPSPANAVHYARIVKEKAARRRVVEGAAKMVRLAQEDASLDEIRALLDGMTDGSMSDGPMLTDLRDIRPMGRRKGIPTGITELDNVNSCCGYPVGQMTAVSAYHKTGKSTWLLQAAIAAARAGYRVIFFTVSDLNKDDVMRKILQMLCGWQVRPHTSLEHQAAFDEALAEIDGWDFQVYDASDLESGNEVETICAILRSENAKKPIGEALIDYAQELRSTDKRAFSEYAEQTICASKLRLQAARMTEGALLVGSQITEGGKDGRDRTKSTRAWEEKAGWVIRLKREEYGDVLNVKSAYSRFGGTGLEFDMNWDKRRECYV